MKKYLCTKRGALYALSFAALLTSFVSSRSELSTFYGAQAPGLDVPINVNDTRFGCKAGGSFADTVWCQSYGGTYDLHVTEANKHAGIVVMVSRTYSDGSGRGYFLTGDYGPTVPSAATGNLANNSVVHCPPGAVGLNHTSSHIKYSPNQRGMFDIGGETHYWCSLNGVAVHPIPGRETGFPMPDLHTSQSLIKSTVDSQNYYTFTPTNAWDIQLNTLKNDSGGYVTCKYGMSGPHTSDQHYHCLTPDGSKEADLAYNGEDILIVGPRPPNFTLSVSGTSSAVEVKAGNRAVSRFSLQNSGPATSFTVQCSSTGGSTPELKDTNSAEPAFSGSTVSIPASMGKNFSYSVDVGSLSPGTVSITCTATPSGASTGKNATDTVSLIAPLFFAPGPTNGADSPTSITFSGTGQANKFTITIADADGLKDYSLGIVNGLSLTTGNPGGTSSSFCGTSGVVKSVTSATVDVQPCDRLYAFVTDCKKTTPQIENSISVSTPNASQCAGTVTPPGGNGGTLGGGGGTTGGSGAATSCANGTRCVKGSWCSNGMKFYYSSGDITCVSYASDGSATAAVGPLQNPPGTFDCDPTEQNSNCVNRGQTVDISASSSKWCGYGSQFYSKDGTKMYCGNWDSDAPSGYSACRASDSNCKVKGEKWDTANPNFYCMNAQKCTVGSGSGLCVGMQEQCPSGTKYCQSTDQYCVEPGESKALPTGTTSSFWCGGGGSMQFYSATQVYCAPKKPGTAAMYTGADIKEILSKLGTGWGLCTPIQSGQYSKCLEPGQAGKSNDWCAWWPPMSTVSVMTSSTSARLCPDLDGKMPGEIQPPGPIPEICPMPPSVTSCPVGYSIKYVDHGKCGKSSYCEKREGDDMPIFPPIIGNPGACKIGAKCEPPSWCQQGQSCYYPDGTLTCAEYGSSCPSGTNVCSPTDKNCIEPGKSGPLDGWCRNAMECYTSDGKEKYCYISSTFTPTQCPSGYKSCRPGDKNCIEIGQKGPSTGWCAAGGKQCYLPEGGVQCVSWGESCPTNAKVCRSDDKNCIEPGKTGPKDGWCGVGSVQCHKKDGSGIFCAEVPGQDPTAWESTQCPADSGRCRPDDKFCLELGKTGSSSSWCVSGMRKDNPDGTVSCVSMRDIGTIEKKPDPEFCGMAITVGYDSSTMACKTFSNTCIPKGWTAVRDGKVCQDGKLVDLDDIGDQTDVLKILEVQRTALDDLLLQLKQVPPGVMESKSVSDAINNGVKELKEIRKLIPAKTSAQKMVVNERLQTFLKKTRQEIEEKMAKVRAYIDLYYIKKQAEKDLQEYRVELLRMDHNSDFYLQLNEGVEKLESLLLASEKQTGLALEQVLSVIKETAMHLAKLWSENRNVKTTIFLESLIRELSDAREEYRLFLDEKDIDDPRVIAAIDRYETLIDQIEIAQESGFREEVSRLVNQAQTLNEKLSKWLAQDGAEQIRRVKLDEVLAHVEARLQAKVDELVNKMTNKLQVLVDTAIQKALVAVADLTEKLSKDFEVKVSQSLSNLTALPEDKRAELVESKNTILKQVGDLNKALESSTVGAFTARKLKDLMATASTVNWCGEFADKVQSWMNRTGLSLENKSLSAEQVQDFETEVKDLKSKNTEECYRLQITSFKDVPSEEWYFGPAEFNKQKGYVKGYADERGNLTGDFGPADPTLRIEALAMGMRIFGVAEGDAEVLVEFVPGVPDWGIGYVNGALNAGFNIDLSKPFDTAITRIESAKLFAELAKEHLDDGNTIDTATEYKDYESFQGDTEGANAVDALSDLEILKGSSGFFRPLDTLVRSEFATINQRLDENLGLENNDDTK